jgi:4-amino-4-deoxy-L-arabinose transferase-like glycosyltransferase
MPLPTFSFAPPSTPTRLSPRDWLMLAAILLLATALRAWNLGDALPFVYHPDEPSYVITSQQIWRSGDLNPHWFHFSSLLFYLNALAYLPFAAVGPLLGVIPSADAIVPPVQVAMGVTRAPMPEVVLLARGVSLLVGVATVALAFATARRWFARTGLALLAALLVALAPTAVKFSRLVTPDALVTFFALAALFASLRVLREGRARHYLVAGLCVGLAASSKYNGILAVVSIVAAHGLRFGAGGSLAHWRLLALAAAGVVAGFLVATPYALLDWPAFRVGLAFEFNHYSTGHPGMEGRALQWYLGHLGLTGGLLLPLALAAVVQGWRARRADTLLVAAFPLLYLGFISLFAVRNDRTLLPALPAFALLAAGGATWAWDAFGAGARRRWRPLLAAVLAVALLAPPALGTITDARRLGSADPRELARTWIERNVPPGSRVAIESYAPFVDGGRYQLQAVTRLIDHPPGWYREQGFDVVVAGKGMYGRFYADPARYPAEIAAYDRLFSELPEAARFTGAEQEVRIHRTR